MNGGIIQETEKEKEKDPGVWISEDLKPHIQCETAAKKANAALGMIMRSFHYRNKAQQANDGSLGIRKHIKH